MFQTAPPSGEYFFFAGIKCFLKGLCAFYTDKSLWKYAVLPIFLMLGSYLLFLILTVISAGFLTHKLQASLTALPDWLAWLHAFISIGMTAVAILTALFLSIVTATTVFEIFAGPFFDRLILSYELKKRGIILEELSFSQTLRQFREAFLYNIQTLLLLPVLALAALFIPLFGPLLFVCIASYRLGFSYVIPSGFLHRKSLKEQSSCGFSGKMAVLCFGLLIYGLFLLPFISIPLVVL